MSRKKTDPAGISMKYDVDAILNWKEGDLGAFHVGYYTDPTVEPIAAMREHVRKVAEPLRGKHYWKILDIGCGVGYPSRQIQSILETQVVGIDFSRKSIELAKDIHSEQIEKGKLEFLDMNVYEMRFENETFDGAYAIESLFHMDRLRALKEIYRCLKPNAVFSVADYYAKPGWKGIFQKEFDGMTSLENFIEMFEKCGFTEVCVSDWTDNVKLSYTRNLKNRNMPYTAQEEWDMFCENQKKFSGYLHITAKK